MKNITRFEATQLLQKHTAPSEIFTTLQSLALKKVRFDDFVYTNKNNAVTVKMQVEAGSYNALTQQDMVFSNTSFILQPKFSNFKVLDTGNISATFNASIDPSLVSYKKLLETGSISQDNSANYSNIKATTTTQ